MIAARTRCENGVNTGGKAASAIKSNRAATKPAGLAEVRDLIKGNNPARHMADSADRRCIYRHHQNQKHRDGGPGRDRQLARRKKPQRMYSPGESEA
jgi:hypothetical protein